jgi:5-(carboxyamino)imidazole ribonucleotide synthase
VILPPATIGILGGGQLGRMTALAARSMGYGVHVLDPDADCATAPVADRVVAAKFDDVEAARDLARNCDVITLEIEQIATGVIEAAATYAPTRPGADLVGIIQDRAKQKAWLVKHGFPLGEHRLVSSAQDVAGALAAYGDAFIKSCRGGYDGRSQVRADKSADAASVWRDLGERPAVAERGLSLAGEMSVLIARRPSGEVSAFPVALNHHERQILAWSVIPAPLPPELLKRATEIGRGIAEQIRLEGLLAIEMFLTTSGDVLVNELAPRPHNSYHASERACATSQFEQLVRAICDLPLGDTRVVEPAAIVNLFGEIWPTSNGSAPDFSAALAASGVRLHLYGKRGARKGRKVGHLSAIGGSVAEALGIARRGGAKVGAVTEAPPDSLRALGLDA